MMMMMMMKLELNDNGFIYVINFSVIFSVTFWYFY